MVMVVLSLFEPFIEATQYPFMQTALLVTILLSMLCSLVGLVLIPKGQSMYGDGLAHASFGGVGLALLAGVSFSQAVWMAIPFTVVLSWLMVWLNRKQKMPEDATLGLVFTLSLAVGISALHITARQGLVVDLEGVLFGNILALSQNDVYGICTAGLLCLIVLIIITPKLFYSLFYEDLARVQGIKTNIYDYIFMTVAAIMTVVTVRAVGVLLVSAWLIIPAYLARTWFHRVLPMAIAAILTAILGSGMGLFVSYFFDIPTGAAITFCMTGLFVFGILIIKLTPTFFRSYKMPLIEG
jgi:zinc transport system permease protein